MTERTIVECDSEDCGETEEKHTSGDVCRICGTWLGAGYLCEDCDTVIVERQHNPTDSIEGLTFYFGAASGSTRKALRELQEPNVMINYATKLNEPWYGIERLFIDSGGYSVFHPEYGNEEYQTADAEYLDYVAEHEPEVFALRDYPCEPGVLDTHDRTVVRHQRMTTDRHRDLLDALEDRSIDAQPLAVVQGWRPEDYLEHLDDLRDAGVLTDYVGIGSVCRRNAEAEIREVIRTVRDALPGRVDLHAFGVKGSVLRYPDVRDALASADSQSFDQAARWDAVHDFDGPSTWHDQALEYLKQKRRIRVAVGGGDRPDEQQQTLGEVVA